MRPILFSLGDFHFMSYGIFVTLSYLVGVLYVRARRGRMGLTSEELWNLVLCAIVGALVGGRVGSVLAYGPASWARITLRMVFVSGGFSFYHGFWGGALAGWLYCRAAQKGAAQIADFFAVAMALAHVPGRLACLFAGCCYGKPTGLPWGIVFPRSPSAVPEALRGVPLHPTQLYEAGGNLLIAAVLHLVLTRKTLRGRLKPGSVFWAYILCYAALRFATDPLRGVDPGRLNWMISTGQWDAVLSAAAALAYFLPFAPTIPVAVGAAGHDCLDEIKEIS